MSAIAALLTVALVIGGSLIAIFLVHRFRYVIWSGYFRAEIVCEDEDIKVFTMRLKRSDREFHATVKGSRDTYHILEDRIYRIGRFRIPKSYYNAHQAEPIDMQELTKESKVSSERYNQLARNTVTSQLISAFSENPMREALIYTMAIVILLGGMLILGYFINSRIETVIKLLSNPT